MIEVFPRFVGVVCAVGDGGANEGDFFVFCIAEGGVHDVERAVEVAAEEGEVDEVAGEGVAALAGDEFFEVVEAFVGGGYEVGAEGEVVVEGGVGGACFAYVLEMEDGGCPVAALHGLFEGGEFVGDGGEGGVGVCGVGQGEQGFGVCCESGFAHHAGDEFLFAQEAFADFEEFGVGEIGADFPGCFEVVVADGGHDLEVVRGEVGGGEAHGAAQRFFGIGIAVEEHEGAAAFGEEGGVVGILIEESVPGFQGESEGFGVVVDAAGEGDDDGRAGRGGVGFLDELFGFFPLAFDEGLLGFEEELGGLLDDGGGI